MRKLLLSIFLSVLAFSATAAQLDPLPMDQCKVQAPFGFPVSGKQSATDICRKGYVLESDNNAKIPVWVSYVLTPAHATGCLSRSNRFAADHSLQDPATPKDYAKSGFDIGHQANDSDMRWDVQVELDSFILSNMAPQLPGFNRGIWKRLEDQIREWAVEREHDLTIYVGPVYNRTQDSTLKNLGKVTIPHAFYKIVVDDTTHEAMVYLFRHEPSDEDLSTFITSIDEVQRQTGVTFPLPADVKFTGFWDAEHNTDRATKGKVCALPH